jgi:hypothetical protein
MKAITKVLIGCMVVFLISCEPPVLSEETPSITSLKLLAVTPDFAKSSVKIRGEVLNADSEIGIVYSTSSQPVLENQKLILRATSNNKGEVEADINNLKVNQRYFFRLYIRQSSKVVYSNEISTVLTSGWRRLKDVPHTGQPLSYGWMGKVFNTYYSLNLFIRNNYISESSGQRWSYLGSSFDDSGEWQSSKDELIRNSPIYLPYADSEIYFFGGGYYYIPEPRPVFIYQKSFSEYRGSTYLDYPGDDVPTVQFAIGKFLPDLYVLEVGNNYRLWKYQNRQAPANWELVKGGEFPNTGLTKLLAFTAAEKGYILSEDDNSLWAFDPITQKWSAYNNTPFKNRERGSLITITKGGVYGLGYNPKTGEGYRDLWLYDDQNDTWNYLTDYPGEGNANVIAVGRDNKVGFMLGYRATTTPINTAEFSATKDVWIYLPN